MNEQEMNEQEMNEQEMNKNDQNNFSFDHYALTNISEHNRIKTDDDQDLFEKDLDLDDHEDLFEEDLDLDEEDLLNKINMHEQERENIVYNLKNYINNLDDDNVLQSNLGELKTSSNLNSDLNYSILSHSSHIILQQEASIDAKEIIKKLTYFILKTRCLQDNIKHLIEIIKFIVNKVREIGENQIKNLFSVMNLRNFYKFNKVFNTERVYFCKKCYFYTFFKTAKDENCYCNRRLSNYFYYRPLVNQLEFKMNFYSNFLNDLNYFYNNYTINKDDNKIIDIYESSNYLKYIYHFTKKPNTYSITINNDDISPFKKSNLSFFFIFIQFNKFKPCDRKKIENSFLLSVFVNNLKRKEIEISYEILFKEIRKIEEEGIFMKDDIYLKLRILIHKLICDLFARAKIIFMKSTNYYFYHFCKILGIEIEGKRKKVKVVYSNKFAKLSE